MSIATAITNLQGKIANAYTAIENKGGTLPATRNAQNLATAIGDIPQEEVDKRKYGATIDDVFYVYDTGPYTNPRQKYFRPMAGVTSLNFTDITVIEANQMRYMFTGKTALKSASFPVLAKVGDGALRDAFSGSGISSVSFPTLNGFILAGNNGAYAFQSAFQNCTALSDISFPALSSFSNHTFESAFEGCTSLSSVSFPEVTYCYNYALYRAFANSGVKSVIWPKLDNIYGPGTNTFEEAYTNSQVEEASFPVLVYVKQNDFKNAFKGCSKLSSISFPELVEMGQYGFYGAFDGCTSLKSASLPKCGCDNYSFQEAFKGCTSLTSISFPEVTTAKQNTFYYAFQNCTSLSSASFPKLSSVYGTNGIQRTFEGCTALQSLLFPELLTIIEGNNQANHFASGCTALSSVSFPKLSSVNGANVIASIVEGCTKLSTVSFPELLTLEGAGGCQNAFKNCTQLTSVSFPKLSSVNGANVIASIVEGCTKLSTVSFPELLTLEGAGGCQNAFKNCTQLTSVSFPKLYKTGGTNMFNGTWVGTQVTTLSFPELSAIRNVGNSNNYATFKDNTTLTRIDFPKLTVMAGGNTDNRDARYLFSGCTNLTEIHFAEENQSLIEGATYYSSKWGAPNANCQIYFDL